MASDAPAVVHGWGLRKYLTMVLVSTQDALAYRATAVVWMLVDFVPSVVMILVWQAAYGERPDIEGYTLPEMVTYYLLTGMIAGALTSHAEFTMNWEIREGRLTPQLTKPISYPVAVMGRETGWLVAKSLVGLPVFALLIYLFRDHVVVPELSLVGWVGFVVVFVLAYLILSLIGACLGCISLWTVESGGIFELWWSVGGVLTGSLLPLELLPGVLRGAAYVMPHRWAGYFPVRVLLGKVSDAEIWLGVLAQAAWVAALCVVLAVAWRLGTRKYEGWGG